MIWYFGYQASFCFKFLALRLMLLFYMIAILNIIFIYLLFIIFVLQITWQRKGEDYPLTVSTFSFLSDGRMRVEHDESSEWNLLIPMAEMADTGIYQCRVTTNTMVLVREIHLTVKGETYSVEATRKTIYHILCVMSSLRFSALAWPVGVLLAFIITTKRRGLVRGWLHTLLSLIIYTKEKCNKALWIFSWTWHPLANSSICKLTISGMQPNFHSQTWV